jgi:hypothetical protein
MGSALTGAVAACGGDNTGPSPATLPGSWVATKAEFVAISDPNLKFDLIARGATVSLVLTANGTFTLTIQPQGEPELASVGNWSNPEDDQLTLTFTGGAMQGSMNFDMSLNGDVLSLAGADYQFDVDDNDSIEPVKFNLTMARQ